MEGRWHARFEKFGREKELPGVIGIELLLKSELRIKQDRHIEAKECLDKVLELSELPSLSYLKERAVRILKPLSL